MTLPDVTIEATAGAMRSGEVTSVELTSRCLTVIQATDQTLGSFLTVFADAALAAAEQADAELAAGHDRGPLHGIPLGIKDIISSREAATTAQSLVLDSAWSSGDAPVVARLRAAGAVIVGKTTTMEFAYGFPDFSKPFPIPRNPWNPQCWAGGSSSGSASAVATGAALGALGTDTGGSIRIPAAYCGITGLKPTYGQVPVAGCVPLAFTIDAVGPMARSARDCATLLAAIASPTAADDAVDGRFNELVPAAAALTGELRGVRIGVDRLSRFSGELEDPAMPGLLQGAIDVLVGRGATVREVVVPLYQETTFANQLITVSEALAFHRTDLRTRWGDYFQATRANLAVGVLYSAADYVQAQRVRGVAQRAVARLFEGVDLIVTPTVSIGASTLEHAATMLAGRSAGDLGPIHTVYWNAVGCPALSVPMGFTASGMPLGLQLVGRPFDETGVLRAGEAFQRDTDWHLRQPPPLPTNERWIAKSSQ